MNEQNSTIRGSKVEVRKIKPRLFVAVFRHRGIRATGVGCSPVEAVENAAATWLRTWWKRYPSLRS